MHTRNLFVIKNECTTKWLMIACNYKLQMDHTHSICLCILCADKNRKWWFPTLQCECMYTHSTLCRWWSSYSYIITKPSEYNHTASVAPEWSVKWAWHKAAPCNAWEVIKMILRSVLKLTAGQWDIDKTTVMWVGCSVLFRSLAAEVRRSWSWLNKDWDTEAKLICSDNRSRKIMFCQYSTPESVCPSISWRREDAHEVWRIKLQRSLQRRKGTTAHCLYNNCRK